MVVNLLLVAAGGAVGASSRYLLVLLANNWSAGFPLGTLLVNVLGSFAIGLLVAWAAMQVLVADAQLRLLLQTGFLGAFTTFSAFSLDTVNLFNAGQHKAAVVNIALNVVFCLIAVLLAMRIVRCCSLANSGLG